MLLRQPPGEEFVELPDLLPVVAVTAVYVILPDPGGGAADGEACPRRPRAGGSLNIRGYMLNLVVS